MGVYVCSSYVGVCVCMHACIHVCVCAREHVCMCVCVSVCVCVCVGEERQGMLEMF